MKVKISKEELKRELKRHGITLRADSWIGAEPHEIALEGEPLQDNGTVEKTVFPCTCGNRGYTALNNNIHYEGCPAAAPTIKDIEPVDKDFDEYNHLKSIQYLAHKINELVKGFNTLKNRI